jgi:hypothetical protein
MVRFFLFNRFLWFLDNNNLFININNRFFYELEKGALNF